MASERVASDEGVGFAVLFTLVALGGAVLMLIGAGGELAGWGFALAVVAGSLAVVGIHAGER